MGSSMLRASYPTVGRRSFLCGQDVRIRGGCNTQNLPNPPPIAHVRKIRISTRLLLVKNVLNFLKESLLELL